MGGIGILQENATCLMSEKAWTTARTGGKIKPRAGPEIYPEARGWH
jgi:hypothetical protein